MSKKKQPQSGADRLDDSMAHVPEFPPAPTEGLESLIQQTEQDGLRARVAEQEVEILVLRRELHLAKARALDLELAARGVKQSSAHE
jgi:hypothetical protein